MLAAALVALAACESPPAQRSGRVAGVVLDARDDEPESGATVRVEPGGLEVEAADDGTFSIDLAAGVYGATASRAGRRASEPESFVVHRGEVTELTLVVPDLPDALVVQLPVGVVQAGYGKLVTLTAEARDPEGDPLTYVWRQVRGPDVTTTFQGQGTPTLSLRTRPLDDLLGRSPTFGPLAISTAGQGEYTIEVTVSDGTHVATGDTRIRSGTAQGDWPRLALGVDGYFDCGDVERPDFFIDSTTPCRQRVGEDCTPPEIEGADTCTPRIRAYFEGAFYLSERTTNRRVLYEVGRWFGVNDGVSACARRDCHAAQTDAWRATLHATVFARGLDGELREDYEPACAKCHALGNDVTARNHGFDDQALESGWHWPQTLEPGNWDAVPPELQDLANVQCSNCHGPAQFWTGLSVGVCAQCHDAPPEYPKVAEWRASPMSRFVRGLADDDPALDPACTRCHSVQGFLAALREEKLTWRDRPEEDPGRTSLRTVHSVKAPDADEAEPITCAACHDAHTTTPRLMRVFGEARIPSRPEPVSNAASSAICLYCHNAQVDPRDPADVEERLAPAFGAQADMHYGTGAMSVPPAETLQHSSLVNCIDCHKRTPTDPSLAGQAGDHTFLIRAQDGRANVAACADCHDGAEGLDVPAPADWDGDGVVEPGRAEVRGLLGLSRVALDQAIAAAALTDCSGATVAASVTELDGHIVLVDRAGAPLEGCEGEPVRVPDLALYRVAFDLLLVERDGSEGLHEPRYTVSALQAAIESLLGDAAPDWAPAR